MRSRAPSRLAVAACLWAAGSLSQAAPPKPFGVETFAQIRAAHSGKPVVVHLWGMTCGPCLGELPKWGTLLKSRPDLAVVFIQVDEAAPRAAEDTLKQAGLGRVESWGVTAPLDEYLRASIDRKWYGDMPRTLLIAPDGAVTRLQGVADLESVRTWWQSWKGKPG